MKPALPSWADDIIQLPHNLPVPDEQAGHPLADLADNFVVDGAHVIGQLLHREEGFPVPPGAFTREDVKRAILQAFGKEG